MDDTTKTYPAYNYIVPKSSIFGCATHGTSIEDSTLNTHTRDVFARSVSTEGKESKRGATAACRPGLQPRLHREARRGSVGTNSSERVQQLYRKDNRLESGVERKAGQPTREEPGKRKTQPNQTEKAKNGEEKPERATGTTQGGKERRWRNYRPLVHNFKGSSATKRIYGWEHSS